MDTEKIIKYLRDAIPQGEHPAPYSEWVSVRLDVVQEAVDALDWLERGVHEWRESYKTQRDQVIAVRATARIAIRHLHAVLNESRSHDDQQRADTEARDWLQSIGSEPGERT